jgi:hypothetical protein
MQQRADIIAKTNPGIKAANGWLHALGVPLEYVEALFEHIPQIFVFLVFEIAPLIALGYAIRCAWTHRRRFLNCCKDTESVQTSNNISNQLSNQTLNQKVGGSALCHYQDQTRNFTK